MDRSSNGSGLFVKVSLGVVTALVVAGIGGGISAVQRLATLEAREQQYASRLERIEIKVDRLLERGPK